MLNKLYLLFCVPLENSKYGHVSKEQLILLKLYDAALHKMEPEDVEDLTTEGSIEFLCKLLSSLINLGAENSIISSVSDIQTPQKYDHVNNLLIKSNEHDSDAVLLILEALGSITAHRTDMNLFMTKQGLLETTVSMYCFVAIS
jgi:hypothetical protein